MTLDELMVLDDIKDKRTSWLPSFANHVVNGLRTMCGHTNACANPEVLQRYRGQSIIFASIHRKWDDSVALWDITERYGIKPKYGLMRDTLFNWKYLNLQPVLQALGAIPVKRSVDHKEELTLEEEARRDYNRRSIAYATSLLANGAYMLFYPQGTRRFSEVGEVHVGPFQNLIHMQGVNNDIVVLPVFVSYNETNLFDPAPRTVVHFGEPLDARTPEFMRSAWIAQMEDFYERETNKKLPLQK